MPKVKYKERILKAARVKHSVTYKGAPMILSGDFLTETFQSRKDWQEIFKVMKRKDLQPRLLYSTKVSFGIKGEIESFPDKKQTKKQKTKGVHHHQINII